MYTAQDIGMIFLMNSEKDVESFVQNAMHMVSMETLEILQVLCTDYHLWDSPSDGIYLIVCGRGIDRSRCGIFKSGDATHKQIVDILDSPALT